MKLPLLGWSMDERFLMHRLRSTSIGGVTAASLALVLFMYRLHYDHVVNWDLFAVGATFVVVKLAVLLWYHLTD